MEQSSYLQLAFDLFRLNKKQQAVVRKMFAKDWRNEGTLRIDGIRNIRNLAEQLEILEEPNNAICAKCGEANEVVCGKGETK